MADGKHTPGPLEAHSSIYEGMCAEVRCIEPGRERGIAQVWKHSNGFYDAQLYAAAPDLLAALEEALPELDAAATAEARANKAPTGLLPRTFKQERAKRARAAIAKATGVT